MKLIRGMPRTLRERVVIALRAHRLTATALSKMLNAEASSVSSLANRLVLDGTLERHHDEHIAPRGGWLYGVRRTART